MPITQEKASVPITDQVRGFCDGGAEWVQLRIKGMEPSELEKVAREALGITKENGVKLIVDDHVWIAEKIGADGVHLGKKDMEPSQAREILGKASMIGGTADSFRDIQKLKGEGVDYIGLGPYRPTRTKTDLSPLLGLEGYDDIIERMREKGITIPVLAIGGIRKGDIPRLMTTGVDGVAVSSAIVGSSDIVSSTRSFIQIIEDSRRPG